MMSYANNSQRPWVLDEDAAEPIVRAAADGGINFYDTADVYSAGASETATGRLLGKMFTREEVVVATKVHGETMPGPNGRGLSASTSWPPSTRRWSASTWTTWTCTRSTAGKTHAG